MEFQQELSLIEPLKAFWFGHTQSFNKYINQIREHSPLGEGSLNSWSPV